MKIQAKETWKENNPQEWKRRFSTLNFGFCWISIANLTLALYRSDITFSILNGIATLGTLTIWFTEKKWNKKKEENAEQSKKS